MTTATFSRRGYILADQAAHKIIQDRHPKAYDVKNVVGKSKVMSKLLLDLHDNGFYCEFPPVAGKPSHSYVMVAFRLSSDRDEFAAKFENTGNRVEAYRLLYAPE